MKVSSMPTEWFDFDICIRPIPTSEQVSESRE